MAYRIAVDTGGTFTDCVVQTDDGSLVIGKAPTTPDRAFHGMNEALEAAASELETSVSDLLLETDVLVYGTTRATNAILEDTTAKTAFLVTNGFADVLVFREGGKLRPFDLAIPFPEPYIPRHLTFEIPERIDSEGEIVRPLDEAETRAVLKEVAEHDVEAIAICLLWSIVNPAHEVRLGELCDEVVPGVPITLSHQLNPIIREYRRASSTAIDASLKPLMAAHLREISEDLKEAGFDGELMAATSFGGVMHLDDLVGRPIYSVKSGPSMAPRAGQVYADLEMGARDVVVCDTGGTSFDVGLVRDGMINFTRDTWLGDEFLGHLTGMASVDVRSVGAGGGSIAWIDSGGLLRVGPQSAGAVPGPACYGRGGTNPTVTDAALVLGYLDPERFLGGRMGLNTEAAKEVLSELGSALGEPAEDAATATLKVANEHMVTAIQQITINEGVDPRESLLVAGGGAAGLGILPIARELGCTQVLVPRTAGALSAAGAQYSDIVTEFTDSSFTDTYRFDFAGVNHALAKLDRQATEWADRLRQRGYQEFSTDYYVEARYAFQVWDLEVPVPVARFETEDDVAELAAAFDRTHERVLAVAQPGEKVECRTWKARFTATAGTGREIGANGHQPTNGASPDRRQAFFAEHGWLDTPAHLGESLSAGDRLEGPALILEPTTTLVVYPETRASVTEHGNYLLEVT